MNRMDGLFVIKICAKMDVLHRKKKKKVYINVFGLASTSGLTYKKPESLCEDLYLTDKFTSWDAITKWTKPAKDIENLFCFFVF